MATDLHNHLKTLAANNSSEDLDALEEFWTRVGGTADSAILSALPRTLDIISRALADYSDKIQQTHDRMIDAIKDVALEVLGAAALVTIGELLTGGLVTLFTGAGGELVASRATARIAAIASELLTALGGSIAIASVAEAAAGLTMAISSTPDPNVEATEATRVGNQVGGDLSAEKLVDERLGNLDEDTRATIKETIGRAEGGNVRFPGREGIEFQNSDGKLPLRESDYYHEWTVAKNGQKRGVRRIIERYSGRLDHLKVGQRPRSGKIVFLPQNTTYRRGRCVTSLLQDLLPTRSRSLLLAFGRSPPAIKSKSGLQWWDYTALSYSPWYTSGRI
ncbi:ribonuclease domain-containing protein [Gandjariella thermophila]|uniref:Uncharacterized protein n=1 Tax=Gandjariella thermophila TaxID=1931992 RepID=A0A4D4JJJ6_9PSEU|nr:ribonuclease domain-containing protein [Gandjariella thermophila]GDY34083.1 hypothetical protein GTS_57160 [Gandjariella thermophila]